MAHEGYALDSVTIKRREPRGQEFPKRCVANPTGLPGFAPVVAHANTVGNMTWALRERVLGSTVDGEWVETLKPSGRFATTEMLAIRRRVQQTLGPATPITHDAYCAKYAGMRRAVYERAMESLKQKPLVKEDAVLNCFLKAEKATEIKAPRVISPRDARFLLAMGVYIAPIEHSLYWAFKKVHGSPVIMKGLDQEARAAVAQSHWDTFLDPVAVGLDASKFDQHTSRKALQFEHGFYLSAYDNDKDLARMCAWQLENKCYATVDDGKVAWSTDGGRMSGDVNTAVGNCVLSATMLLGYSAALNIKVKVMVDGDDCVVFMEKRDVESFLDGLTTWYEERGYRMKREGPYTSLHQVEFCQSRWMMLNGTPMFVRNPFKALNQDHTWVAKGGTTHADVMKATGLGGLSIYGDVPVLGAYYSMLAGDRQISSRVIKRLDLRSSWLRWSRIGEGKVYATPTSGSRVEFYRTFGIHACDQVDLERVYLASSVATTQPGDSNQITNHAQVRDSYRLSTISHTTSPTPV